MDDGNVRNSASGNADQLVQAGVVHGGVHVHRGDGRRMVGAAEAVREALWRRTADEVALRGLYQFGELRVPWEVVPGPGADAVGDEGRVLSSPAAVADAFLAMPARRLVLVGDGGSGKSTLALLLARELGERAATDPTVPLPVLTTAASWNPQRVHLRVWFVQQLASLYPGLDKRLGRDVLLDLVESGVVFPVLDGLDELPPEQRDLVLAALARTLAPSDAVVLTCREDEFREAGGNESLPALTLHSQPVGGKVVEQYLTGGNNTARQQWAPVIEQLREEPSGVLASSLNTPLMLWLARRTATVTSPHMLADRDRLADTQAVQNHLLDALIPTVFGMGPSATQSQENRWKARNAQRYLSYLALRFSRLYSQDLEWSRTAPRGAILIGQLCLLASLAAAAFGIDQWSGNKYNPLLLIFSLLFTSAIYSSVIYAYRIITSPDSKKFGRRELLLLALLIPTWLLGKSTEDLNQRIYLAIPFVFILLSLIFHVIRTFIRPEQASTPRERMKLERNLTLSYMAAFCIVSIRGTLAVQGQHHTAPTWVLFFSSLIVQSLFMFCFTPWGRWHCGRAALAMTGRLPWRTHAFLDDARRLGVIRLSGGNYQFRHITLQKRLAGPAEADRAVGAQSNTYRFSRRLPWRRRPRRALLPIGWTLILIAFMADYEGSFTSKILIVIVGMAWPVLLLTLFVRRCLLLGTSVSVVIDHDRLEVTHHRRRIVLAPHEVRRLSVRAVHNSAGRPTRYHAVQAILRTHASSSTDTPSPQEWVTLIPLTPMHPLDTPLREALARFGGTAWEPPTATDHRGGSRSASSPALRSPNHHGELGGVACAAEQSAGPVKADKAVGAQSDTYRFSRRLPWRRRPRRAILPIGLALGFIAFMVDCEGSFRSNLPVVIVGMTWPVLLLTLFVRRCLLLGTSVSVVIDHDRLEVTHHRRRIVLAPHEVRRLSVRAVQDSVGRPTRYHAVQAILRTHASSSTDAPPSQEWVTLIPLTPMHPLDTPLREALARFGGTAWEPPPRD
ncbi:NACHT domain-containing protein [Streptomyces sp. NPDC056347]|uniref:NACHT domain-containing protein n=1 Tax=Streptomyces sp. NPDC056347 TaxID=3345790 RepID=UPI0035D82EB6